MTDYQNDKKAEKRAVCIAPWVWLAIPAIPAIVAGYWFWTSVIAPIICGVTAGCGSASW